MENYNAYEALGKYLVKFQEIPMIIQNTIQLILNGYGLKRDFGDKSKDNTIASIILAERSVDHLLNIHLALIEELFGENSDDFSIIKKITTFIKNDILPDRNNIFHSFLYVDESEMNDIHISRQKFTGKSGFSHIRSIPKDHLTKKLTIIEKMCTLLHYINQNFEQNKNIIGKFQYGNTTFDISVESINKEIEILKQIVK